MTERQYNSKLLGDKLSLLPVPPNEALWSRIEAQLLIVPPVVQHPPAQSLQHTRWLKVSGFKIVVAIVAIVLLAVVVIRLSHKKPQPNKPIIQKIIAPVIDSLQQNAPLPVPEQKKIEKKVAPLPAPPLPVEDTQPVYTPVIRNRKIPDFSLRDTISPILQNTNLLHADSLKPLPLKKKEEDYYFEIKKKKS